ncbi:hypothetical protein Q5692_06050 [Microcoleus sp. C2C3]|uniref:hypothetical protein n=1 Tax=unclassified Microcoleus TaxID=2642155 RepID=UPI002FD6EF33
MKFFATGTETRFFVPSKFERLCVSCDRAGTTNTAIAKSFRGGLRLRKAVCSIAGVFYIGIRDRTYGEENPPLPQTELRNHCLLPSF